MALVSCNNDLTLDENTALADSNAQKEIAFAPLAQKAKHVRSFAPVVGDTFPTLSAMQVAAWDVTNNRDFFEATEFAKDGETWKGGKYWPLAVDTINFLAYAELNAGSATWDITADETSQKANGVVLVMADNKTAQKDLMYAIGTGGVRQNADNTLTFPGNIAMSFKHAQAWVRFMVKAKDEASNNAVTLDSIILNGAKYNGTFTVTHTNYDKTSGQSVDGVWSAWGGAANVKVPGWERAAIAYAADPSTGVEVGKGLLVVPDNNAESADFTSFTVHYTLDGKQYSYTYTPATAAAKNLDKAKKYTFNITFKLHLIEIAPEVTDWVEGGPTAVQIGGE